MTSDWNPNLYLKYANERTQPSLDLIARIGLTDNAMTVDSYDVTLPERTVHGTYAAKLEDMQTALDLLAAGKIEYESWIERFPITRADEAFRRMLAAEGRDIKAIVQP